MRPHSLFASRIRCAARRGGLSFLAVLSLLSLCVTAGTHDIRPGPGVTETLSLSVYHEALADTPGDTPVYLLEGDAPGGTVLILGGSHPNEIASVMAAVLIVEQADISAGRLFVVPYANNSAAWYAEGMDEPSPRTLTFVNEKGEEREFAYGSRLTDPAHQGPDGDVFVHYPSGAEMRGHEARNLNRVHPGRPDGTLTQKISYALFELVERERVDIVIDMHEAPPTARLANMLIAHPDGLEQASIAVMELQTHGISLGLEVSREEFFGLSHLEFGNRTDALSFLTESPNPAQESIAERGDPVDDPDNPLTHRVRLQLLTIKQVLSAHALLAPGWEVAFSFPFSADELLIAPLGAFLR